MFVRGAMSRANVVRVIRVDAISNGSKAPFVRQRFHLLEEFVLAVIAAIRTVHHIKRVLEFARFDERMSKAQTVNKVIQLFPVMQ